MPSSTIFRENGFHGFARETDPAPSAAEKPLALIGRLDFALREQIAGEVAFCRDFAALTAARVARLLPQGRDAHVAMAEGHWPDDLEREFTENFMPVRPGQRWGAGAADKIPVHADRAGTVALGAVQALWRTAALFRPFVRAVAAWRGLLFKAALVGLIALAGADLLAKWPDGQTSAAKPPQAAPRDAWLDVARPYQTYELSAPLVAHEKHVYSARRHAAGGGREDILTFGQFAVEKNRPFVRLSIYRHGQENIQAAPFFVDMARRAAPLGLGVSAVRQEPAHPTRFGDIESAALTLSENDVSREHCRGFRLTRPQPGLTIAGLACAAEDDSGAQMTAQDVACLLNRLDLLAAGSDRPLRDFFGAAEARNVRGCGETGRRK
jgi:hypothetical protein